MSIIGGIKSYLQTCPHLQEFIGAYVDFTEDDPSNYGIMPAGDVTLQKYIGGAKKQYNFVLYAREFTFEDIQRLENCEFLEHLSDWIFTQDQKKNFPFIGSDKQPSRIQCANGFLFNLDEENGDRGLYQIQFQLFYFQKGAR